ncbi:MAG TPA: glycosyltransferase [Noviherbaspirillum sp.]|nr:glycosyltransferase [Noviherbaspirillum sp.]
MMEDKGGAMISDSMAYSNEDRSTLPANPPPRILVATSGTGGDILPFVRLARELSRRGHQVVMLVPQFHELFMQSQGLAYRVFGTAGEFQSVLEDPDLWDERKGFGVVWRGLIPHLGVIRALVAQQPANARCLLLCHPILVPLADLAKSARPDLHIVCAYLAPSNLCSSYDFLTAGSQRIPSWLPLSWRRALWRFIFKGWIDPAMLPDLNAFRAASRLPPVSSFFDHMHRVPAASIGLFPDWFAAVQPDWPAPFFTGDFPLMPARADALLSPQLEGFLADGDAPIVFTPGTGHRHAEKYFALALKALQRLGRRGLFVTPCRAQVPADLPPQVIWLAQAPFDLLLPRVAAVVHHGGIGTTAEAFRAGIPQLIAPYAFDQFDNGLRAQKLGVADVVLPRRMTARRVHKRLARLLSSREVAQSCARISERAAQGSFESLVRQAEAALDIAPMQAGCDQTSTAACGCVR